MSIYDVIESKVIDYSEIVVVLFEDCNLVCSFCPQNHSSQVGVSKHEILSKIPAIVNWINTNTRSKNFKLHIMGGEVFQDKLVDKGFLDVYQEFMDTLRTEVTLDKDLVFNYITNLVFDNPDPIIKFLKKNNLTISTSYDSKGRFNSVQLDTFKKNVEVFKDLISMVSVVTTRQNILAVIKGDSYFDYLYENFNCDWDSFIPAVDEAKDMMPKESELLALYKLLVDKYPECYNIQYFTSDKAENKMSCTRGNSFTVLHDGTIPTGCSGELFLKGNKTEDLKSGEIVINFLNTYNCFTCEYYKKCPFTCFIKNDYKHIERDVEDCVFKLTFKYVDEKNKSSIH
jgi:hypothetical protein